MADFILRSSPPSPFGRKVKIAAKLLGLMDRIEVVVADTNAGDATLYAQNPLGKIPCLIPNGGAAIFDSRVILEYLDIIAGGGQIIPAEPAARIKALTLQALADGLMDAALLRRYEVMVRSESERSASWDAKQKDKVDRALDVLEANLPALSPVTVGEIAVASALGYLDLRFPGSWREGHPKLAAWLDAFAATVPAFGATAPH